MDKQELIESIRDINKSAKPEFLAEFTVEELRAYLEHLAGARLVEVAICE